MRLKIRGLRGESFEQLEKVENVPFIHVGVSILGSRHIFVGLSSGRGSCSERSLLNMSDDESSSSGSSYADSTKVIKGDASGLINLVYSSLLS